MRSITGKLGNMRKSVEWTVYPSKNDGTEIIQSDKGLHRLISLQNERFFLMVKAFQHLFN